MDKSRKDRRVQVLMSEPELQAVDDFRFTNRISSRAEAIRTLCLNGMQPARRNSVIATDIAIKKGMRTIIRVSLGSESFDIHLSDALQKKLAQALVGK